MESSPGQILMYRVTIESEELTNATMIVLKIQGTALDDTSYVTINCTVRLFGRIIVLEVCMCVFV